ncbi:MAG: phenylalanine--tRNA ligase subunit alpha, partial [Candidatus Phosphoribacter sp.]
MSGPRPPSLPVDGSALEPRALDAAVHAALTAFAEAGDFEGLKAARLAHLDKGPVAQARREIGALAADAKAEAGKRVGEAMDAVRAAYLGRVEALEAERDARILIEEGVDVTVPTGRRPLGARHPVELTMQRLTDVFVAMGWEVA